MPDIAWSGSATHVRGVARALERIASGEVEYLAVRAPNGQPISIGGIDYCAHENAGALWQLATHPSLRSLGLGTRLIEEAERRIRARGVLRAVLGVEDDNLRARALYARLGYRVYGHGQASWEAEDANGVVHTHVAECALLEKHLD